MISKRGTWPFLRKKKNKQKMEAVRMSTVKRTSLKLDNSWFKLQFHHVSAEWSRASFLLISLNFSFLIYKVRIPRSFS